MEKLKMHSPDITAANIAKLLELFPNCATESHDEQGQLQKAIDFDLLRQELSPVLVEGPQERYQLNWPGKAEALLTANAPIAKTLRPCREESVDFDTTQNLFIEGDNLDALKLLQETYLGKVKMIYIDPPYNTGSDLVYRDSFKTDSDEYLVQSAQYDENNNRLVANSEANGRFHSTWLDMMYARLRLAKNLLKDDGVILISIDDHEIDNLKKLGNEIFGEANFIATLIWEKSRKNDAKFFSVGHEYIVVYAKAIEVLRAKKTIWREEKPGAREIWDKYLTLRAKHGEDDKAIEFDIQNWYAELPKGHPSKKWSRYKRIDSNGPWRDRDISWPGGGGPRDELIHPITGKPCAIPESGWRFNKTEMAQQIKAKLVEFRLDESQPPFRKAHIRPIAAELVSDYPTEDTEEDDEEELATQVRGSYFYKQSQVSVKALRRLIGGKVFNNPKDHMELARLITYITGNDPQAIIMDFFAGSGSTGHALFEANLIDGGKRRFILVQIPEKLDPANKEQKAAAEFCTDLNKPLSIAEISKERLRRTAQSIISENLEKKEAIQLDTGFRVLKIATSNMADVYYSPDKLEKANLSLFVDNILPDRTAEDLLFQVMLDWGLDLAYPITQKTIQGKQVFFVDGNGLAACFDADGGVDAAFVKELATHKPLRVVFRDAGFRDSTVKINVGQIFKLLSPATDIKTI